MKIIDRIEPDYSYSMLKYYEEKYKIKTEEFIKNGNMYNIDKIDEMDWFYEYEIYSMCVLK